MYGDPETVRRILEDSGDTWAVVGLSTNERRAAYGVAGVLQRYGKRIVPVHPLAETVLGEQGYPSLAAVPFPEERASSAAGVPARRAQPGPSGPAQAQPAVASAT